MHHSMNTTAVSRQICPNAFDQRIILSNLQLLIMATCLIVIILTIIPINLLLVISMVKTRQIIGVSKKYILVMSISDCLLGAVTIPTSLVTFTTYGKLRSCKIEYAAIFMQQFNVHVSVYMIFLLALHRYIKLTPNFQTQRRLPLWVTSVTGSRCLIVASFFISACHGTMSTRAFGSRIGYSIPSMLLKAQDIGLAITVSIIYIKLFFKIKKHTKTSMVWSPMRSGNKATSKNVEKPRYVKKLAKTIFMILLAVSICYFPFILFDLWTSFYTYIKKKSAPQMVRFLYYMSWNFTFLNGVINALIIIYRNEQLRRFIRNSFTSQLNFKDSLDDRAASTDTSFRNYSSKVIKRYSFRENTTLQSTDRSTHSSERNSQFNDSR